MCSINIITNSSNTIASNSLNLNPERQIAKVCHHWKPTGVDYHRLCMPTTSTLPTSTIARSCRAFRVMTRGTQA